MCGEPFEGDVKRIQGREGVYRLRVGDLRVLYSVNLDKRLIEVATILPRGDAYH